MAIKPFEFTNADVLINQKKEQIDAMRASGDPRQQQLANSQVMVDALFGDPAIQKARATDKAIKGALELTQDEGESDLDFNIRQQKRIMTDTASLDPNVAVQANQNIRTLMTERDEQSKLVQEETYKRESRKRERKKQDAEDTPVIFRRNPDTGNLELVEVLTLGTDPMTVKKRREELQKGEEASLVTGNVSMLFKDQGSLDKRGTGKTPLIEGYNASEASKILKGIQTATITLGNFGNVVGILEEDPEAFLFREKAAVFDANVQGLKRVANVIGYIFHEDDQKKLGDEIFEDAKWQAEAAKAGYTSARAVAYATQLAYQFAKMLDPGGRLSDQDVQMAKAMIIGKGTPTVVAELIKARMRETYDTQNVHRAVIEEAGSAAVRSNFKSFEDQYNEQLDRANKLAKSISDRFGGGASDIAPKPEERINGYQSKWGVS